MEKYERRILIRVSDDDNVMWSCAPSRNLQFLHEKWVKEIHDETTMALIKNMELCWEIPLDSFINCIMPLNRVNLLDFLWFFCLFVNWNWLFWFVTDRCIDRWMVIFFNLRSLKKKSRCLWLIVEVAVVVVVLNIIHGMMANMDDHTFFFLLFSC